MRVLLTYALARLAIFAGCTVVLWFLFGNDVSIWPIVLVALLFTSGLSWLLLRKQGGAAGAELSGLIRSLRRRFEESRAREDLDPDPEPRDRSDHSV